MARLSARRKTCSRDTKFWGCDAGLCVASAPAGNVVDYGWCSRRPVVVGDEPGGPAIARGEVPNIEVECPAEHGGSVVDSGRAFGRPLVVALDGVEDAVGGRALIEQCPEDANPFGLAERIALGPFAVVDHGYPRGTQQLVGRDPVVDRKAHDQVGRQSQRHLGVQALIAAKFGDLAPVDALSRRGR